MGIEAATYIDDLNPANPPGTDPLGESDDHVRLLKNVLKSSFPNISGAMTATHTVLNGIDVRATNLEAAMTDVVATFGADPGNSLVNTSGLLQRAIPVRAVTGTTDTIVATDIGGLVTYSNAAATAVTLPQAGAAGFLAKWFTDLENNNDGVVTVTTTTSTIGGSGSTWVLGRGQRVRLISDGTNWHLAGAQLRKGKRGADIATATTLALPATLIDYHQLTGTVTVTGIAPALTGTEIELESTGVAQFTHNATSFILLGAANVAATAAGDVWRFRAVGAAGLITSNWKMVAANLASGKPLVPTYPIATQAETVAKTANKLVDGANAKYHPGVVKASVSFTASSGTIIEADGVTSVTRNGTGDYTLNLGVTFANLTYRVIGSVECSTFNSRFVVVNNNSKSTTACGIYCVNGSDTKTEGSVITIHVELIGTLA